MDQYSDHLTMKNNKVFDFIHDVVGSVCAPFKRQKVENQTAKDLPMGEWNGQPFCSNGKPRFEHQMPCSDFSHWMQDLLAIKCDVRVLNFKMQSCAESLSWSYGIPQCALDFEDYGPDEQVSIATYEANIDKHISECVKRNFLNYHGFGSYGMTPLIAAIELDNFHLVNALLKRRDIKKDLPCAYTPYIGRTPLHFAAMSTKENSVQIFLALVRSGVQLNDTITSEKEAKASFNYKFSFLGLFSSQNSNAGNADAGRGVFTILHMLCKTTRTTHSDTQIRINDRRKAQILFKQLQNYPETGKFLLSSKDEQGESVLIKALVLDDVEFVLMLLIQAGKYKGQLTEFEGTKYVEVLEYMEKKPALPDCTTCKEGKALPNCATCEKGLGDTVRRLIMDILYKVTKKTVQEMAAPIDQLGSFLNTKFEEGQFSYLQRLLFVAANENALSRIHKQPIKYKLDQFKCIVREGNHKDIDGMDDISVNYWEYKQMIKDHLQEYWGKTATERKSWNQKKIEPVEPNATAAVAVGLNQKNNHGGNSKKGSRTLKVSS
jgi:hypothetical protein